MPPTRMLALTVAVLLLAFSGSVFAAGLKLEVSEAAKEEIANMGEVAYLSVFELGSG